MVWSKICCILVEFMSVQVLTLSCLRRVRSSCCLLCWRSGTGVMGSQCLFEFEITLSLTTKPTYTSLHLLRWLTFGRDAPSMVDITPNPFASAPRSENLLLDIPRRLFPPNPFIHGVSRLVCVQLPTHLIFAFVLPQPTHQLHRHHACGYIL